MTKLKDRREELIHVLTKKQKLDKGLMCGALGLTMAFNLVIGGLYRLSDGITIGEENSSYYTSSGIEVELGDAIRETYDPHFHAAKGFYTGSYLFDREGYKQATTKPAYRDSTINTRWKVHTGLCLIEAFILALGIIGNLSGRSRLDKDVDTMLEIEELAEKNGYSKELIMKMIGIVPIVIEHMSKESRLYFDLLMSGNFDYQKDTDVINVAREILRGHLQSHPEDMQKVLSAVDDVAIPFEIKRRYKCR